MGKRRGRRPNGQGTIVKLSGNRKNPYAVKFSINGKQKIVGYGADYEQADKLRVKFVNNPWNASAYNMTFQQLYELWKEERMPKLGEGNAGTLRSAYSHCEQLYSMRYREITSFHMQKAIDTCGRGYSTQGSMKALFWHLERFARELRIIDVVWTDMLTTEPHAETTRTPFTEEQIETLWSLVDEPWVNTVLIFLYTGFRLNELLGMKTADVNLIDRTMTGGIKTGAGKDRVVPIHSRILPLVERLVKRDKEYLFNYKGKKITEYIYYSRWKEVMELLKVKKTPHEARHTFETRLDNAGANRKCIDMLMGHKSKDIGSRVYTHKTIEQLREAIELLK